MTNKTYKTAMGRTLDMGALVLKNENTRAVGNMGVNAKGDVLDSSNQTIDSKPKQTQRQYRRQVNTTGGVVHTSTRAAREATVSTDDTVVDNNVLDELTVEDTIPDIVANAPDPVADDPVAEIADAPKGGLAAAIAKSKEIKQELMQTPRQKSQLKSGVTKI